MRQPSGVRPTSSPLARRLALPALSVLGLLLLGAKDEGCGGGGIYFPPESTIDAASVGDGRANDGRTYTSADWPTPAAPTPGTPRPMTCEWLASDNCWKRMVRQIVACAPEPSAIAPLSEDRQSCTYANGSRVELGGPVNAAPSSIQVTNQRVLNADGSPCFTGKIVGFGKVTLSSATETAFFESPSLLKYNVTCNDGTTWTNDGEGVCPTFGVEYLAGRTPGSSFVCNAGTCTITLTGADAGRQVVGRCDGRDGGT